MPLVINSLGGRHTHTNTHTYRRPHRNNFKKSGTPDLKIVILKNEVGIDNCYKKVRKQDLDHVLASGIS